eukprot:TRINITY_DN25001_c0_g1_i2.p1 TRINITY_DN25001_c0_g1~~TRINITY_DN25001_c0_g1_i2.p1  ORF type:complete len:5372 (+),score=1274.22 TRINITY_DN25001_c0_g1_i2:529-16116(+)
MELRRHRNSLGDEIDGQGNIVKPERRKEPSPSRRPLQQRTRFSLDTTDEVEDTPGSPSTSRAPYSPSGGASREPALEVQSAAPSQSTPRGQSAQESWGCHLDLGDEEDNAAELRPIGECLTRKLSDWLVGAGISACSDTCVSSTTRAWKYLFEHVDASRSTGRARFCDFKLMVREVLHLGGDKLSEPQLASFWSACGGSADAGGVVGSSSVPAETVACTIYRLQLASWPMASAKTLSRNVAMLSDCARKMHRRHDQNITSLWRSVMESVLGSAGKMDFADFSALVRRDTPGLRLPPEEFSDSEMRALWKALDENKTGKVTLKQFLKVMTRLGGAASEAGWKSDASNSPPTSPASRGTRSCSSSSPSPGRQRSGGSGFDLDSEEDEQLLAEVRDFAVRLRKALVGYFARQGISGGSGKGFSSIQRLWREFLQEFMRTSRPGYLTFSELSDGVRRMLGMRSVSESTLRQFWEEVGFSKWNLMGYASVGELAATSYRLQLETWPMLHDEDIERLFGIFDRAIRRLPETGQSWRSIMKSTLRAHSGVDYEDFVAMVRRSPPGLLLKEAAVSELELQGFWRCLDRLAAGKLPMQGFLQAMMEHRPESPSKVSSPRSPRKNRTQSSADTGPIAGSSNDFMASRRSDELSDVSPARARGRSAGSTQLEYREEAPLRGADRSPKEPQRPRSRPPRGEQRQSALLAALWSDSSEAEQPAKGKRRSRSGDRGDKLHEWYRNSDDTPEINTTDFSPEVSTDPAVTLSARATGLRQQFAKDGLRQKLLDRVEKLLDLVEHPDLDYMALLDPEGLAAFTGPGSGQPVPVAGALASPDDAPPQLLLHLLVKGDCKITVQVDAFDLVKSMWGEILQNVSTAAAEDTYKVERFVWPDATMTIQVASVFDEAIGLASSPHVNFGGASGGAAGLAGAASSSAIPYRGSQSRGNSPPRMPEVAFQEQRRSLSSGPGGRRGGGRKRADLGLQATADLQRIAQGGSEDASPQRFAVDDQLRFCESVSDTAQQRGRPMLARGDSGLSEEGTLVGNLGTGYLFQAPVLQLLRRLREDQPEDLRAWLLLSYCYSNDSKSKQRPLLQRSKSALAARKSITLDMAALKDLNSSTNDEDAAVPFELQHWRFFILDKEKEIQEKAMTYQLAKPTKQSVAPQHFQAFLPHVIKRLIIAGTICAEDSRRVVQEAGGSYNPVMATFPAVVVFADASGFTALTETLARRPHGAEEIGACINGFFKPLIQLVIGFGGDILKFSGDALTILWPVGADYINCGASKLIAGSGQTSQGDAAAAAAAAACCCCLEVHAKAESFGKTPVAGLTLSMHIGVGFGKLSVLQFGGLMNRFEYCAAGPPLSEVAIAEPLAKTGETVISPSVQDALRNGTTADHPGGFELASVLKPNSPPGYRRLLSGGIVYPRTSIDAASTSAVDANIYRRYIPQAILERLQASSELEAEMRRIAVIFLSISGLDAGLCQSDAMKTQRIILLMQRSVYALEGSINKFLVDDKGMLLLAVFGLPPLNHYTDDPMRAVLATERMIDTLREENVHGQAGVATGLCWCGVVGSDIRREYTVLGDVVNLSARLMGNSKNHTIMVDTTTFQACRSHLGFDELDAIPMKGKAQPVKIFRFNGQLHSAQGAKAFVQTQSPLLSFKEWPVKKRIVETLEAQLIHPHGPGGVIFLEGGPGCGKSAAAEHVRSWAAAKGFALLDGQNMNPTGTFAVSQRCWQEVFEALIEAARMDPHWQERVRSKIAASLVSRTTDVYTLIETMLADAGAEQELLPWLPLLSFVIPSIHFGAKGMSAIVDRDVQRAMGTPRLADLCAKLIDAFACFSSTCAGTVVMVHMRRGTSFYYEVDKNDGHIATAIANLCLNRKRNTNAKPLIFCMISRSEILSDQTLRDRVKDDNGFVSATDFDRQTTELYMEHLLKNSDVGHSLVDYVYEVCGGNPFSVEVLTKQLEENGVLARSEDGSVEPAEGWDDPASLRDLPFHDDLVGMALATFDKLSPRNQIVLKAAAVVSREAKANDTHGCFCISDILHSLQGALSAAEVEEQFQSLTRINIIRHAPAPSDDHDDGQDDHHDEQHYIFVSRLLRHVASMLVLEVQKKQMQHRVMASKVRMKKAVKAALMVRKLAGVFKNGEGDASSSHMVPEGLAGDFAKVGRSVTRASVASRRTSGASVMSAMSTSRKSVSSEAHAAVAAHIERLAKQDSEARGGSSFFAPSSHGGDSSITLPFGGSVSVPGFERRRTAIGGTTIIGADGSIVAPSITISDVGRGQVHQELSDGVNSPMSPGSPRSEVWSPDNSPVSSPRRHRSKMGTQAVRLELLRKVNEAMGETVSEEASPMTILTELTDPSDAAAQSQALQQDSEEALTSKLPGNVQGLSSTGSIGSPAAAVNRDRSPTPDASAESQAEPQEVRRPPRALTLSATPDATTTEASAAEESNEAGGSRPARPPRASTGQALLSPLPGSSASPGKDIDGLPATLLSPTSPVSPLSPSGGNAAAWQDPTMSLSNEMIAVPTLPRISAREAAQQPAGAPPRIEERRPGFLQHMTPSNRSRTRNSGEVSPAAPAQAQQPHQQPQQQLGTPAADKRPQSEFFPLLEAEAASQGSANPGSPTRQESEPDGGSQHEMLDWRFFVLTKEQEVFDKSRKIRPTTRTSSGSRHFNAFLPDVIRDAIVKGEINRDDTAKAAVEDGTPAAAYSPTVASFSAAVVFADASGFTNLTETLARQPHGAELIGACINSFFGPLIEIVVSFGGDILKFSGDALTILWRVEGSKTIATEENEDESDEMDALDMRIASANAAAAACCCCLELQAKVDSFGQTPVPGLFLTLHIGVGFGKLNVFQLGGLMNRWEYCAAGAPLEDVSIAEPLAKTGETVVSPSVQRVLNEGRGFSVHDDFEFQGVEAPETPGFARLIAGGRAVESAMGQKKAATGPALETGLYERYIPQAIMKRLSDTGETEAEMRRIAVIFLSIRGLDPGTSAKDAFKTQKLLRLFQRSCYALEGSVNKFLVDDKGMLLLAVFGLPPLNHYIDDPIRAILATTRLIDTIREEGIDGRAGVATGLCWCGVVGSHLRREYTVLGDVVNLSARLMSNAERHCILVDTTTHEACKQSLEFVSLGAIRVKGKSNAVPIFKFTGHLYSKAERAAQNHQRFSSRLVQWPLWPGRTQLVDALEMQLKHSDGPGGVILTEGGPGTGKGAAVEVIKAWAASKNFSVICGQNMDPTSTFSVPWLCWQEVFEAVVSAARVDPYWRSRLQREGPSTPGNQIYHLIEAMLKEAGASEDLLHYLPLLSLVVQSFNFGAKGVSAMLARDEQRTAGTSRLAELCGKVLNAFASHGNANHEGAVILIHMKRGSSFYYEMDVHDAQISKAVMELCFERRKVPKARPLIFCAISRTGVVTDEALRSDIYTSDGIVALRDLTREYTEQYMGHLFGISRPFPEPERQVSDGKSEDEDAEDESESGEKPVVPSHLVNYVYEVCGGNPFSIEVLSEQLESLGVIKKFDELPTQLADDNDDRIEVTAGWEDYSRLRQLPFPDDLRGMALAAFEKLSPQEQTILKAAAVCESSAFAVTGEDEQDAEQMGVFTINDLYESMDMPLDEIEEHCLRLVDAGIFRQVESNAPPVGGADSHTVAFHLPEKEGASRESKRSLASFASMDSRGAASGHESFVFVSTLLRHVASTLVLEVQRQQIRDRRTVRRRMSTASDAAMISSFMTKTTSAGSSRSPSAASSRRPSRANFLTTPTHAGRRDHSGERTSVGSNHSPRLSFVDTGNKRVSFVASSFEDSMSIVPVQAERSVLTLPGLEHKADNAEDGGSFVGVVKSYDVAKGWGMVHSQEATHLYGDEILFLKHDMIGSYLRVGDRVSFHVVSGEDGPLAVNVRHVDEVSESGTAHSSLSPSYRGASPGHRSADSIASDRSPSRKSMLRAQSLDLSQLPNQSPASAENSPRLTDRSPAYESGSWRFFALKKEESLEEAAAKNCTPALQLNKASMTYLSSFLPQVLRAACGQQRQPSADGASAAEPASAGSGDSVITSVTGFLGVVDVSGCTLLADSLTQVCGADETGSHINDLMGQLVELALQWGGDILKISGETMMVLWQSPQEEVEEATGKLAVAVCRCCLDMRAKVQDFAELIPDFRLGVRIGVGHGSLSVLQLGGVMNRWSCCAIGAAVQQAFASSAVATAWDVVLSSSTRSAVAKSVPPHEQFQFNFQAVAGASGHVCLVSAPTATPPGVDAAWAASSAELTGAWLQRFMPQVVLEQQYQEGGECQPEICEVTVVLLSIAGLGMGTAEKDVVTLREAYRLLQKACTALEGAITDVIVSDKGLLLVSVFGLPPLHHGLDDALRASLAATRYVDILAEQGLSSRAAVSSGSVWHGVVGGSSRRGIGALGGPFSRAASLLKISTESTVVVDSNTYNACRKQLDFESMRAIQQKEGGENRSMMQILQWVESSSAWPFSDSGYEPGTDQKTRFLAIFKFTGRLLSQVDSKAARRFPSQLLSWREWPGRAAVVQALEVQMAYSDGPSGVVAVEGGIGAGKTEAVEHIKSWTQSKRFQFLSGQNMNQDFPFHLPMRCWQDIFQAVITSAFADPHWQNQIKRMRGRHPVNRSSDVHRLIHAMLEDVGTDQDLLSWVPLLSYVIPSLCCESTEAVAMMRRDQQTITGVSRLAELCAKLLEAYVVSSNNVKGAVVVLHMRKGTTFFEEPSCHDFQIAKAVAELCRTRRASCSRRALIFCIVSRPGHFAEGTLSSIAHAMNGHVSISDLDRNGVERYMGHLLAASSGVTSSLVDHVFSVTGGNPFGVEMLCKQLQAREVVRVSPDFRLILAPEWRDADMLGIMPYPEELKTMTMAFLNRLAARQRATLGAAAVCCKQDWNVASRFTVEQLGPALNMASSHELEEQCVVMTRLGVLREVLEHRADSWLDARTFKFSSLLFMHTALSLVTKEKQEGMQKALSEHREKTLAAQVAKSFAGLDLAHVAATKIQALHRGFMVRSRKDIWMQAALRLQAIASERANRHTAGLALRRKAAVQIQRLFRQRRQATEIAPGRRIQCSWPSGIRYRKSPGSREMLDERVVHGGVVTIIDVVADYVKTDIAWLPIHHPSTGTLMWEAVGGGLLRQPSAATLAASAATREGSDTNTTTMMFAEDTSANRLLEEAQAKILWLLRERDELRKLCGLPAAEVPDLVVKAKPDMTIDEFLESPLDSNF